jgi:hypothetical protein
MMFWLLRFSSFSLPSGALHTAQNVGAFHRELPLARSKMIVPCSMLVYREPVPMNDSWRLEYWPSTKKFGFRTPV